MDTLLLSRSEIEKTVTMKDVVKSVEKTFVGLGEGTVSNPGVLTLDLGEHTSFPSSRGFMNAMPAYVGWLDTAGIKWVGGFEENLKTGLPYVSAMILLIDPGTGRCTAVMDGSLITNMRTGAQAAVALKYLVERKSLRLCLYGAGAQARTVVAAMAEIFIIEELRVYDINREVVQSFAKDIVSLVKGQIVIASVPEEAADGDAVISVTRSRTKFLKKDWINAGTVVITMGSYQECDDDLILTADKIVVDHLETCLKRGALKQLHASGRIGEKSIYGTIGEIVSGKKRGRDSASERILCVPMGTGAMDIAVATVAFRKAIERESTFRFRFV